MTTRQSIIPLNLSSTKVRYACIFWVVFIILIGAVCCIEPTWSLAFVLLVLFLTIFAASAISDARVAIEMIIAISFFTPLRFLVMPIGGLTLDVSSYMILTLVLLLWAKGSLRGKYYIPSSPLDKWFILLLFFVGINTAFSVSKFATLDTWQFYMIKGPLFFLLVYHHFTDGVRIRQAFKLIFTLTVLLGVLTLIESFLRYMPIYHNFFLNNNPAYDPNSPTYRVVSFNGNPVSTGIGFSIMLPFFIYGFQQSSTIRARFAWGIFTLFTILGALVTYARGTLFTVVVIILIMSIRSIRSFLIALMGLLILALATFQTGLFNTILLRLNPQFLIGDASVWHRLLMYWTSWKVFVDHPILGSGLATMGVLYQHYKHPLDYLNFAVVDNQFLTFLYGTGIIGSFIIASLFAKVPTYILRFQRNRHSHLVKSLRKAAAVSIFGFYLNSLTFESFTWPFGTLLFWFVAALSMRLVTLPNQEMTSFFKIFGYDENAPQLKPIENPPK